MRSVESWFVADAPQLRERLQQAIQVFNALPPVQRDAWAAMFDHDVVQRGHEPAGHIPEPWRAGASALNGAPCSR
jgi:hypothetical protein